MTEELEKLKEMIFPLVVFDKEATMHSIGTAFVIGVIDDSRYVVMTATHVLDFVKSFDTPQKQRHPTASTLFFPEPQAHIWRDVMVWALLQRNGAMYIAPFRAGWYIPRSDVAFGLVTPDRAMKGQKFLALDTRPVVPAGRVLTIGYPSMDIREISKNFKKQTSRMSMRVNISWRQASIVELAHSHVSGEPGFLVDAPFDSGMSGGPILDLETCAVRGVISSDISEQPGDLTKGSAARAFGCAIAQAMYGRSTIELMRPAGDSVKNASLKDMVRLGICRDLAPAPLRCFGTATLVSSFDYKMSGGGLS